MKVPVEGWYVAINDQFISTGGGFDYFITLFRHKNNPRLQVEVFIDTTWWEKQKLDHFVVNVGLLDEATAQKEPDALHSWIGIDGDPEYLQNVEGDTGAEEAFRIAYELMRKNPEGNTEVKA
jgi:hypothetical protein